MSRRVNPNNLTLADKQRILEKLPCTNAAQCEGPPKCYAHHDHLPDAGTQANQTKTNINLEERKEYPMRDRSTVCKTGSDDFVWDNPARRSHDKSCKPTPDETSDAPEVDPPTNEVDLTTDDPAVEKTSEASDVNESISTSDNPTLAGKETNGTNNSDTSNDIATEIAAAHNGNCANSCVDVGNRMIECTSCERWFHITCASIPENDVENESDIWYCRD